MTKSSSDNKAGLPAWFLIVGLGGLVGIIAGAVMIFAPTSKPVAKAEPVATPAKTGATTQKPTAGNSTPFKFNKQPVTYEEWMTQIDSTTAESYPAIMDGALRVKDAALRGRVVESLLLKWLNADVSSYLAYLDQLEGSADEGKDAWPVLVPAFVKAVPQLGEEAATSSDLEEAVLWMTDYYAEQDPNAALAWARKWLLDEAQESALASIAGQLSKTSLDQAVAVANGLKSPNSRIDAMANIGAELGGVDPRKALEWAQSLKDPSERGAAVEEVMWAMSDKDPSSAASIVKQLNNPELLENIGGAIAESLADKDSKAAVDWAEAIPAGAAQDEAITGALTGWAKSDPKAAFTYFESKHSKNLDAAEGIFEQWASNTPEAAAAEALKVSDASLKEHAVVGVVNGWLNFDDTQAAEQWVDQMPVGRQRDLASATLVDALSVTDPQPAWDRAVAIKDAQVRQEAMLSAFSGLAQMDPSAARSVLGGGALSADDKKLLQPVLDSIAPQPKN